MPFAPSNLLISLESLGSNITLSAITGWRYCPVALSANGRVKPDVVLVDGKEERHAKGAYYIDWRENGKRVRLSVGKHAADANARRLRKESELNARNNGVPVLASDEPKSHRRPLAAAITDFLEETKLTKKPKTYAAYSTSLEHFRESCKNLYLEDITRRQVLPDCSGITTMAQTQLDGFLKRLTGTQ